MRAMKIFVPMIAMMLAFAPAQAKETSPETIQGATTITVDEAKALFDKGVVFVDVRSDSDFEAGRIPGAVHLELKKVLTEAALTGAVSKDQEVVIYCNGHSCMRSSDATAKAVDWGFTNVKYYRDGFPSWQGAGHPVE